MCAKITLHTPNTVNNNNCEKNEEEPQILTTHFADKKYVTICMIYIVKVNNYPAEFLNWNNPPSSFGTVHYHF